MRSFRDKPVKGWEVVDDIYPEAFARKLNELMDKYDFIDCQFSTADDDGQFHYTALVLVAEK